MQTLGTTQFTNAGGHGLQPATRYSCTYAYEYECYTVPYPGVTTSTTQSYLNGYRAFVNTDANIFYILATYKF